MFPAPSDFFLVFLLHSQHLPWCIECYNHREDCRNITRIIYFIELTIYCQPAETPCLQFPQQPNLSWVMNSKWHEQGISVYLVSCVFMTEYTSLPLEKKISIPSFDSPPFWLSPFHPLPHTQPWITRDSDIKEEQASALQKTAACLTGRPADWGSIPPELLSLSLPYTARKESQHSRAYQALPQSNLWHELCVSADLSQAAGCWHAWKKKYSDPKKKKRTSVFLATLTAE